MVYVRGNAQDYEEWEESGATDWGYRSCLPYFKRAESWIRGGDAYRGDEASGVSAGNDMRLSPLYRHSSMLAFSRLSRNRGLQR